MAPKYKLTYFDVTALGEPIRFLFNYGGIEFEDYRFQREQWPSIKERMPFGQVPILEFEGKTINQSLAISRYVARLIKLAGKDDLHALEIDAMVDNINDLRTRIAAYNYEPDEDQKEKKRGPLVNETLPSMLEKLNSIAEANNGYFVRGELSWADIVFVAWLDYLNYMMKFDIVEKYPALQKVRDNVLALPAIKKWIETRPKTDM